VAVPAPKLSAPPFPCFPGMGCFFIVALTAVPVPVPAGQGKGRGGMIEFAVAIHAGGAHGSILCNFFCFPRFRYSDPGVALHALHRFMEQRQGEPRLFVVESGGGFERIYSVAFTAVVSQPPLVNVPVAGGTFRRDGPVEHGFTETAGKVPFFRYMAFLAGEPPVSPFQGISGIGLMIE